MNPSVYKSGTPTSITVTMPTVAGGIVVPSAVTRLVKDETGAVVATSAVVDISAATPPTFSFNLDGAINISPGRSLRQIVTTMVTPSGTFEDVQYYLVEGEGTLERLTNTFVLLPETMLLRREFIRLDGWDASTELDRVAALQQAHSTLSKMLYRYRAGFNQDRITFAPYENRFYGWWAYVVDIGLAPESEWEIWPTAFRTALQKGQMAEADVYLRGDPVAEKRAAGILSEKIGESAMSFANVKEVDIGISLEALRHLRGYVYRDTTITRG